MMAQWSPGTHVPFVSLSSILGMWHHKFTTWYNIDATAPTIISIFQI